VRAEVVRSATADGAAASAAAFDAERACVEAGAAPDTVRVECAYEARQGQVRAVATGAVALERGAAGRSPVGEREQHRAAALALGVGEDTLQLVAANRFYRVYCENGSGPVAVVDGLGSVPLATRARTVLAGSRADLLELLRGAVDASTVQLGVASVLPRVAIVSGPRIVDTSEARRCEDVLATARAALADDRGDEDVAVAVVWR